MAHLLTNLPTSKFHIFTSELQRFDLSFSSKPIAMNLEDFKVQELPGTVYYIPEVISVSEESLLLDRIAKSPKTKWTHLRNRALQNWGGMPHAKGMIPEQMPDWLEVVDH
jgi:hypothetical protein